MSKVENVISDEAVEAAAKAMHDLHKYGPRSLEGYMHDARAALEAAAPHILAQGWDGAATYIRNDMEIAQRIYVMKRIKAANPYRSQS